MTLNLETNSGKVNSRARPGTIQIGAVPFGVKPLRDFLLRLPFDEEVIHSSHGIDFLRRPGDKDDTIGL